MQHVVSLSKDELDMILEWAEIARTVSGLTPREERLKEMLRRNQSG